MIPTSKRLHDVVDIVEVAHLRATAEEADLFAFERKTNEDPTEALAIAANLLPGTERVRQSQHGRTDAVGRVIEQMIILGGELC